MLIRLSKNSFVRCYDDYAYIVNQITQVDLSYNETGAEYLRMISREPQDVNDILNKLFLIYGSSNELCNDFNNFINHLAQLYFLVLGETEEELNSKDLSFSYGMPNVRRKIAEQSRLDVVEEKKLTQRFMEKKNIEAPRVLSLQFELTSRCNERCIHCYIPNEKKNAGIDMPTAKVLSIIDEFSANGGLEVTLSGGEVLMHKGFVDIIRYCRSKDLKISVLTNLIALTDKELDVLKEVNINYLQVSLYSMDSKVHDMITTVKGSFEKTMVSIKKLIAANVPIQIACPTMKANYKGYVNVLKYADSIGVKASTDYILMGQTDKNTQNLAQRLSLEETEELLRDIMLYDKDYLKHIKTTIPPSKVIEEDYGTFLNLPICGVGRNSCCITADGNVYPCAGWQGMVLGNIYKNSLEDIWLNSEKVEELRRVTQRCFPKCLTCEARDYCAMCMCRNYNESDGDYLCLPEHACKVAFLTKRLREEILPDSI